MTALLCDGWLVVRAKNGATFARHGSSARSIELRGALSESFWDAPERFVALGRHSEELAELALAESRIEHPSLREVLAPSGFGRLFLELTGRCNENCTHCYASSSPTVETALSREKIEETLREAKSLGFVSVQLTGGDPLVSPHVERAAERAFELGFETIEVYTNGLAFSKERAELFSRLGVKMAFSVYSNRPEIHDAVTRTYESHKRTLRAIRIAVEHGIDVRVSVVLMGHNTHDTAEVRAMVEALGVRPDRVACDRERPVGRGEWREEAPIPDEETPLTHALPAQRVDEGRAKLAVTYEGKVVPCIFDRSVVFGSIHDRTLSSVLEDRVALAEHFEVDEPRAGEPLACTDCGARHRALGMVTWASRPTSPPRTELATLRIRS